MDNFRYIPKHEWAVALSKATAALDSMLVHGQYTSFHVQAKALIAMVVESIKMEGQLSKERAQADEESKIARSLINGAIKANGEEAHLE